MIIKVCGFAGEGKSGLASYIERCLALRGIDATVIDDDEEQYLSTDDMCKKLDAIAARDDFEVRIETVNVQLRPKENL